ncbi:PaaX family transcriptional regulator [Allokutzneria sp. A3M-2-11 16]|uniref:PaaX family transcriptional regulator n=1 Tax=Allokutzneria sp. A3M-2-11 16 TaxID=2962043 RepID=UPI0020B64992|nr:PaaX family transcriptional regulator C-terminal domain-containing protein [Allokutzneria sp. A3M-2-11 16]MCP3798616.1 PaaX family transcriptional regulator [Allokutzneria sp. A3M-2-11 16]
MRARSALFDVYGGHLRQRGGTATIAALVRLLEPLGFAPPAVRTAVSRTVRQGWLRPVRLPAGPGYAMTARAEKRLDEASARVFRTRPSTWDGRWHVVVLEDLPARPRRDQLTSSLKLIGYGELGPVTWISPRPSPELTDLLAVEGAAARIFHGEHDGDDAELAGRAWDLNALGADYQRFVEDWSGRVSTVDTESQPAAFAVSQELLHAWRKFLFRDPSLPPELLPPDWPGHTAARFFDQQTERLAVATNEFIESCLGNTRTSSSA